MDRLEYIDDYCKGLLSDEQQKQFELQILSDPSFAEELAFYISAGDLLKEELKAEKKARFKELYEQSKTQDTGSSPIRRLWISSVAVAAVLIAFMAFWWVFNRQDDPEKLADNYITQELQILPVKMNSIQDSMQKAVNSFNTNNLHEALVQFEQILQRDSGNELAYKYAGIVCLRLKEYDKSLYYFRQLERDSALNSNPALFYESLTLMKRMEPGDTEKARQLLQQVVDGKLEKMEDAQRLLNKHWK